LVAHELDVSNVGGMVQLISVKYVQNLPESASRECSYFFRHLTVMVSAAKAERYAA
jgi:hypothetical protein